MKRYTVATNRPIDTSMVTALNRNVSRSVQSYSFSQPSNIFSTALYMNPCFTLCGGLRKRMHSIGV